MKTTHYFLFLLVIGFSSCVDDLLLEEKHIEEVVLESLRVSEETNAFLDFYQNNDQIILEKNDEFLGEYDLESVVLDREDQYVDTSARKLWVIEKQGGIASEFKSRSCTIKGVNTRGGLEKKFYTYKDDLGNLFRFQLSIEASVDCNASTWNKISENFQVTYSEPCTYTYIDYRVIYYMDRPRCVIKDTKKYPIYQIGSKEYHDVMKLTEIKEGSHFVFYVSKHEGILRVDDLDRRETWIVKDK